MVGTYVVCRRLVFLSGGITHSSFGGIGIAYYLGLNPLLGAFCFAVLSAIGIEACAADKRIREDSAIGLIWSLGMAVGIIFVYMTPGYAPNLMSFMFGNILSVTVSDLIGMAVVVAAVVVVFALFYRPVMYVAFDREYAASQNVPTRWIGYLMAVLIAVLISLLTMPAVIANQLTRSFGRMMAGASVVAVVGTLIGLYASYLLDIPSGAATIFVLTVALIIVKLLPLRKFIRKRNENGA